jgi:hypothetical protein
MTATKTAVARKATPAKKAAPRKAAPVVIDGETDDATPTNGSAPAVFEDAPTYDPDWEHERIEYKGDDLAVRKPTMQALAAFQLSSGKYISGEKQNDMTGLFVDQHLAPDSYDRIMQRLMDPDDPSYTTKSVSEIMGMVVQLAIDAFRDENADGDDEDD